MANKQILFFSFTVLMFLAGCSNSTIDQPIIRIGDTTITEQDFYQQLKQTAGKDVLKQMTFDVLLNKTYKISEQELTAAYKINHLQNNLETEEQVQAYLNNQGLTKEQYEAMIRKQLLIGKASIHGIEITKEDLKKTYEEYQLKVKASHILVHDIATANEILTKLNNGTPFSELAKTYSLDLATKQNGGNLGYFKEGFVDKRLMDAAFSLNVGEVSDPIQTDMGYHLIQTTDKDKSFEEMKETLEHLLIDKRKKSIDEIYNELSSKADIEIFDPHFDNNH